MRVYKGAWDWQVRTSMCWRRVKAWRMASGMVVTLSLASAAPGDADWKSARARAINRPRRIIFNNDGNEPVYFCKNSTEAELLGSRTSPLVGSQVDSVFYCTWSSGFGLFTHKT